MRAGDLKSVVLHKMTLSAQKSSFPIALGVRITGVDDSCFSQTGESYSMITMPGADTHVSRVLQEDNTELVRNALAHFNTHTHTSHHICWLNARFRVAQAYEFARKFPGYTAESARQF